MKISRFEDLLVWQKSRGLAVAIYQVAAGGTFSRDYGLRDQVRRASVSVVSNTAEGFGRYSRAEMRRFVTLARGSETEVQSQLYLAHDLAYPTDAEHRSLNARCVEVSRMLASLRSSLVVP